MQTENENKPQWMKIHSGINEPKHREAMGKRIWFFMHLIDKCNWKTGIVENYTDAQGAIDMQMSKNTLRTWRRELVELGYITCRPAHQGQKIVIHKWRNPREVNPEQINIRGGSKLTPPVKSDPPSRRESDHPSIGSDSKHTTTGAKTAPDTDTSSKNGCAHPDWGDMFVAVKEGWGMKGSRPGVIVKQLIGITDKNPETDISPPATLEEVQRFAGWYRSQNDTAALPTSPLKIEDWFYRFREDGAGVVPVPDFD